MHAPALTADRAMALEEAAQHDGDAPTSTA